jgi:chorismate-pyruvate lyase
MTEQMAKRTGCVSASELIGIYYHPFNELGTHSQCRVEQVPTPYRGLLAHTNHMTVTVESFHSDSVDVEVLRSSCSAEQYCREILLRTHSAGLVVQYGIVRLSLKFLPEAPRAEILEQKKPLGRVLIEHDVLRKIELFELLKIECGAALAKFFSVPQGTITYGRTAILHCNNEPAIELLEIVRP